MKNDKAEMSYFALRVTLGLIFLIPGISKLMNPSMIIGMLDGMGFPVAILFGWIVIIAEVVCGAALIVGWNVKKASWPLIVILIVATLLVGLPGIDMANPMTVMNVLWHLIGLAGLFHVQAVGAGKYAM